MVNIKTLNTTSLAYLGDAVYEVYVRRHVMEENVSHADILHRRAVPFVRADGQAYVIKKWMKEKDEAKTPCEGVFHLTEEEAALVRRARNRRSATKPKNADPITYKWATAFEALAGFLYLTGQEARLDQMAASAIAEIESGVLGGTKNK